MSSHEVVFELEVNYYYLNYVLMMCLTDPILTYDIFAENISLIGEAGRTEDGRKQGNEELSH